MSKDSFALALDALLDRGRSCKRKAGRPATGPAGNFAMRDAICSKWYELRKAKLTRVQILVNASEDFGYSWRIVEEAVAYHTIEMRDEWAENSNEIRLMDQELAEYQIRLIS